MRKAKTLSNDQFVKLLDHVSKGEHGLRDRAMLLMSFKCGLRACEIARIRWSDVTDAEGHLLPAGEWIELPHHITKGSKKGSRVLMHAELRIALDALRGHVESRTIVYSPKSKTGEMTVNALTVYLHRLYKSFGVEGCSSHTGRRTYITTLARICNQHGSSIKDVQLLARHSDIRTTESYIEPAQRLVGLAAAA